MPSKATLNQSLIFAMSEGLLLALLQTSTDDYLSGVLDRIQIAHRDFVRLTTREPGGQYTAADIQRSAKKLDEFRERCGVIDQMLDAKGPCAMIIGLLVDQLAYVRHPVKRRLIGALQGELENLLWYLDPDGRYEDRDSYEAAQTFDAIGV